MNQCMTNDVSVTKSMKVVVVAMTLFFVAASFAAVGAIVSRVYAHTVVKVSPEAGQ